MRNYRGYAKRYLTSGIGRKLVRNVTIFIRMLRGQPVTCGWVSTWARRSRRVECSGEQCVSECGR